MSDLSPIFALEAEQLLLDNEYEEAIELCNKGIEEYPYYPAAYAVLAQAHFEKDNMEESRSAIEKGLSLFPNDTKLNRIKNDIDSKGDNSTLYKKPEKKDLDNLENEIFEPEEIELEEEVYKPDFNKFLEDHPSEEKEIEENIAEKADDESEEYSIEPEPEPEPEVAEETISDDDIDDLFNEQDKRPEPEIESEPEVDEETVSDDDIDDLFNDQDIEPETEVESEPEDKEDNLSEYQYSHLQGTESLAEENTPTPDELYADNLSIIPGLETNPLMISEEPVYQHMENDTLPEYPPFSHEQSVENDKGSQMLIDIARQLEEVSTGKASYDLEEQDTKGQNDVVASETMAKIYIQQGVISKAIQIYEILADQENNPEKKKIYLDKIENLKSGSF